MFLYTPHSAVQSTLIIVGVLCVLFIVLSFFIRRVDPMKKTPLWLVPFLMLVDLMNSFIKENLGVKWKIYSPWFLTLVILIYLSNASAVFLLDNPTGYILVTAAFAICSFFVIQISGIASLGMKGYLKGFLDPTPVMMPMNVLSEFTFPLSLCLRLFGNVMSGSVISILLKKSFGWFSLPVMPFINVIFDLAFSAIQVAVFVILSIVFTSQKIKDEEKIYSK